MLSSFLTSLFLLSTRFQVDIWELEADEDWAELQHRFHNAQFDLHDLDGCFLFLRNVIEGTPAYPYLLSILQHLLLIRDDHVARCVTAPLSASSLGPRPMLCFASHRLTLSLQPSLLSASGRNCVAGRSSAWRARSRLSRTISARH